MEMRAEFTLTGASFDPDFVSREVKIKPTSTWRVGDQIARTLRRRKCDGWRVATETLDSLDLSALLIDLLDRLWPFRDDLLRVKRDQQLDAEFSLVVYVTEETPISSFDSSTICRIATFEASLDVDIILIEP